LAKDAAAPRSGAIPGTCGIPTPEEGSTPTLPTSGMPEG
jgi:hypothetical protein